MTIEYLFGQLPASAAKKAKGNLPLLPQETDTQIQGLLRTWLKQPNLCGVPMPSLPQETDGRLAQMVLRCANRAGRRFSSGELQLLLQYVVEDMGVISRYPQEATRLSQQRQAINSMIRPAGEADYERTMRQVEAAVAKLDGAKVGNKR